MGKSKDITAKEIMPSTTRGGTNLPSRPKFSPTVASSNKNKYAALHSLPLSKIYMPIDNDNELSDDSVDDEVTKNSSTSYKKKSKQDKKLLRLMLLSAFT
jgi:hypothetical protein